jgi:hypothetical protein
MNHLQAKQIVDLSLPALSQSEKLVVRGIADLETSYGNWGPDPLKGAGSNNMGAITDASYKQGDPPTETQFLHTDTRPWTPEDGGEIPPDGQIHYSTAFVKYPSPAAGFAAVATTALKPNVREAIATGILRNVSAAMRANRYFFGIHPTKQERLQGMTTAQGIEKNIDAHAKRLTECIAEMTKATGEPNPFSNDFLMAQLMREQGVTQTKTPLYSGFLSSDWGPESSGELSEAELLEHANNYLLGKPNEEV